jgi:hypothetical protein
MPPAEGQTVSKELPLTNGPRPTTGPAPVALNMVELQHHRQMRLSSRIRRSCADAAHDELHLEFPFAGSRLLRDLLAAEGSPIDRRHVSTLMRRMGIEAVYRRPNRSKPAPGHKIYP